jgi:acetyl-CoA synthetase
MDGAARGNLSITDSWPGQMRTVWATTSASSPPNSAPIDYFIGDGCRRDEDGYYWINGRVRAVITSRATGSARLNSTARSCCTAQWLRPR